MKKQQWTLRLKKVSGIGWPRIGAQPRYLVMLNGEEVGHIYFNMRGYVGRLPQPSGIWVEMGESGISCFKREVAAINRDARLMAA
jgi:hypothetical protein